MKKRPAHKRSIHTLLASLQTAFLSIVALTSTTPSPTFSQWQYFEAPEFNKITSITSVDGRLVLSNQRALYSSDNLGKDWQRLDIDQRRIFEHPAFNGHVSAISMFNSKGRLLAYISIATDPQGGSSRTTADGVYYSDNNATKWSADLANPFDDSLKVMDIVLAKEGFIILWVRSASKPQYSYSPARTLTSSAPPPLLLSSDNGNTWQRPPSAIVDAFSPYGFFGMSADKCDSTILLSFLGQKHNHIFVSHDKGTNWEVIDVPSKFGQAFFFRSSIYSGGDSARISHDFGRTWSPALGLPQTINVPRPYPIQISSAFQNDRTLFLAPKNQGVFYSVDDGFTWRPFNDGFPDGGVGVNVHAFTVVQDQLIIWANVAELYRIPLKHLPK